MACWLKQSTAAEVKVGPFVDNADGFTAETGLTITQSEVLLAKNAGDWAQKNEATSLVHESNGFYRCLLDATDTNTLGILMLQVAESGALPVWREFMVVAANIYDSLIGGGDVLDVSVTQLLGTAWLTPAVAGMPDVNAKQVSGSATAADNLEAGALGIVSGAAATGTLSTTAMTTNLTEATNDHYNGRVIVWTSGALAGEAREILDYDGATKKLTYSTTTDAPSNGDTFVIV